jgi:hypothetical protein
MPDKETISNLITYGWVLFVSAWAGAVSYLEKVRSGKAKITDLVGWFTEIFICVFVGQVTFLMCKAADISESWMIVYVAITAHMGTRALFQFTRLVSEKFGLKDK